MPKVKDIFDFIDSIAPFENQCSWDNAGLNVGDMNADVKKICLALDITNDVIDFAKKSGADLIVSHHPVIFIPRKNVMTNDPVYNLIKSGMNAICAHTCLDIAKGGVNDALAAVLDYKECVPLADSGEKSMVRVYEYNEEHTIGYVAQFVADRLRGAVRYSDCGKPVKKVALCGGAGCSFMEDVAEAGCDLYITGDAAHHDFLNATQMGLSLIAAGHYETENPVIEVLADKIGNAFDNVEIIIAPTASPCRTVECF